MKSAPSGEDENLPGEGEEPPLDQDTILGEEELPQPPAVLTKIVNNSGAALFGLMQGGELAFLENCGDSGFALAEIMRDAWRNRPGGRSIPPGAATACTV